MNATFHYDLTRVCEMQIRDVHQTRRGRSEVRTILVGDRALHPSKRFWNSFFTRFGFSDTVFRYFDHAEVFERISARVPDDTLRVCIERNAEGKETLLAVSSPNRPLFRAEAALDLIGRYGGSDVQYDSGVMTSAHVPSSGDAQVRIGPDEFKNRFVLETPVDGYGNPRIFLSMLRMVCSNGMVAYAPTFRSEVRVGKDPAWSIARALESYDNGEGYAALRQRFHSAQSSWASIHECQRCYRILVKLLNAQLLKSQALSDFHHVTGNLNELYGLANLEALSVKRQRVLPARCRVYDLLNFTTELATHHAQPVAARALHAHVGTLISDEYDMEGTAEQVSDFNDFFVAQPDGGGR